MQVECTHEQATALWVGAFFDELVRWGVRDVVVSPGSRSTALAMAAFEMSCRRPHDLRLHVCIDERSAAFFGLGMAKASGRPAVLVCTSGTAVANYCPAVIEAETSRVPLIVLSGDRPPHLQGLGAPQTTDQLKVFGDHVRAFRAMPLPGAGERDIAFVRQAAREACIVALGGQAAFGSGGAGATGEVQVASRGCGRMAGPVHLNFPFDEPLKPDFSVEDVFGKAADAGEECAGMLRLASCDARLDARSLDAVSALMAGRRTLVLAGEGSCSTLDEAREIARWANALGLPCIADPLSGLRCVDEPLVIDNYDNVFGQGDCPLPELVIRFGRYPVSKRAATRLAAAREALGTRFIVVDAGETRDFNCATDMFVPLTPLDFVRSGWGVPGEPERPAAASADQLAFAREWTARNEAARAGILAVRDAEGAEALEGAYVRALLEQAPAESCVFSASSMAIRAIDTFLVKGGKPLCVLCNRGQNGIDGTVSTALGAAQRFAQTTLLIGDFALQHDLGALALQRELLRMGEPPSVVIVLLNNNGGAIFDMLPQRSDEAYFERLFLAPQDVSFADAARAFGVPHRAVHTVGEFEEAYRAFLGMPGISMVEASLPLRGVRSRYAPYQG